MTKATKQAQSAGRKLAALLAVAVSVGGGTFAGEVWDGNNLTIFGSRDPDVVYEKLMDGETLTAYWVKVGTEAGSARLVMKDSTFTLSNIFYLGTEADPGYTNLTATLVMTNSTLTCTTPCGDVGRMDGEPGWQFHLRRDAATFGLHHPVPVENIKTRI